MGVDYYSCGNCREVYSDHGDYYICDKCSEGFCDYCGEKELVKKYGVWDEENPDDYDEDGVILGEPNNLKSCPICSNDKIDYEKLAKYLVELVDEPIEVLWDKCIGFYEEAS